MREAIVLNHGIEAGRLIEVTTDRYEFLYRPGYTGPPISLTLPVREEPFIFNHFPSFFDGLLPEGAMLEALLKRAKLDRKDYFSQILVVGSDLVGSVTVVEKQG